MLFGGKCSCISELFQRKRENGCDGRGGLKVERGKVEKRERG